MTMIFCNASVLRSRPSRTTRAHHVEGVGVVSMLRNVGDNTKYQVSPRISSVLNDRIG